VSQIPDIVNAMGVNRFPGRDGLELAYREAGSGRPLILLHGFMGSGSLWLDPGPGNTFVEHGHRVILPDFRGHGQSAASHDPAAYPPDVLADDGLALVEHLGLGDGEYDLGGYSLGGRIVLRMLARGARPGRAVAAAQGLAKVSGPQGSGVGRILTSLVEGEEFGPGSPEALMASRISELGVDVQAALNVLDSLVPTPEADLRRITIPTLIVIGDRDERSDADELAALLPNGRYVTLPGDHGSSITAPEFAAAITDFLVTASDQTS
jgi:pimeloyl-ACP methyl ester carboxylesterase